MKDKSPRDNSNPDHPGDRDPHILSLFATERIEDYAVLALALFILIVILSFH